MVQELSRNGVPVAVACRFLKVSTSGYYEWLARPPAVLEMPGVRACAPLPNDGRRLQPWRASELDDAKAA